MQTTTDQNIKFYSSIAADPQLLARGYDLIREYLLSNQHYRQQTLLNLLHPQVPVLPLVINIYPKEIFTSPTVTESEKHSTRAYLMNLTVNSLKNETVNLKQIQNLFSFLAKIHSIQGYENWVSLYENAMTSLLETPKFGYFLTNIFRESDDRINFLSRHIVGLPFILAPEHQIQIIYHTFKSLACLVETDPDTIEKYVHPHIPATLQYIKSHMVTSLKTLKYSLKALTVLYGDFEEDCNLDMINLIESTVREVIGGYLNYLNNTASLAHEYQLQTYDDNLGDEIIQVVLYQMLQLLNTLYEKQIRISNPLAVYLCITSTFLSAAAYKQYINKSDQYLMEIQEEGDFNIRNKSIFFIGQLIQNNKNSKQFLKILQFYTNTVIDNYQNISLGVNKFLSHFKLPEIVLKSSEAYFQSVLFLFYSFTSNLVKDKKKLCLFLGNFINNSEARSVQNILAILILNKIINRDFQKGKADYLKLLRSLSIKFDGNIGVLIAIMKGIYSCSPLQQIIISQSSGEFVPAGLVRKLVEYISVTDSAQTELAYLIFEFFVHLCKNEANLSILRQTINSNFQAFLFRTYMKDGIAVSILVDFLSTLGNSQFLLQVAYKSLRSGICVDQTIPLLISKSIIKKGIALSEEQVLYLLQLYSRKLDVISVVITAYLQNCTLSNPKLVEVLNHNNPQKWIDSLLIHDKLQKIQERFLQSVRIITVDLTSQCEIQNTLILPYYVFLKNASEALKLLNHQNLTNIFFTKIINYARLFQGIHLKFITSHVLTQVAKIEQSLKNPVLNLIESYGSMEASEWQEEQIDEQGEIDERIMDRLVMRMSNDHVEETFKRVFGQLCWDKDSLMKKIELLKNLY